MCTALFVMAGIVAFVPMVISQPSTESGTAALALAGSITARDGLHYSRWNPASAERVDRILVANCRASTGGLVGVIDGFIIAVEPIDSTLSIACSIGGFGYGPYSLVEVSAGASMVATGDLAIGGAMRIDVQSISKYGTSAALMFDVGMLAQLSLVTRLGVVARNIARARRRGIALPQQLAMGFGLELSDSVSVSLDAIHEAGRGIGVSTGVEAHIAQRLRARFGLSLDAPMLAFGIGYHDGTLGVNLASSWNAATGTMHSAGVEMRW
ncbi:MAG: hypothetical protein H7X80_00335 [bacterium]|nr:hypothetical protein [Candidatus Kapabacteria bacterium]